MDIIGEEHGRLERLTAWLGATRAELVGLVVLLLGAAVASGALWWTALGVAPGHGPVDAAVHLDRPLTEERDPSGHGDQHGPTGGGGADSGDPVSGAGSRGTSQEQELLTVHVTGAVASPGVITVAAGARVADAITAAGEATDDGEPHRLNLARPLTDGEQIHVPVEGEEVAPSSDAGSDGVDADGLVDLNRADTATLETLPGIGPARAEAIVGYREEHGPFAEPGDLRGVSGIGEATFQRLAELVTVS